MVLVPPCIRVHTPWASLPSSLANDFSQTSLVRPATLPLTRCQYLQVLPVTVSMTELEKWLLRSGGAALHLA
jgi:hypothetical protein